MTHTHPSASAKPLSDIRRHFIDGLAYRPRSGQAKNFAAPRPAEAALKLRYISPDQKYRLMWLKIDIDHKLRSGQARGEHAAVSWLDAGTPPPHFIVCHPHDQDLGAHLMYGLLVPVGIAPNSRIEPQLLFQLVSHGMTTLLGGDPAYSGQTIKNPLHRHWRTLEQDVPLYSLSDLLDCLPESLRRRPIRDEMAGEGRNTDLFFHLRQWSYSEVYAASRNGRFDLWERAVLDQAHALNRYNFPLPMREIAKTARSVARWTWKRAESFERRGTAIRDRSKIYSQLRPTLTDTEGRARMVEGGVTGGLVGGALGAPITHAIRRNKTFDAITGAIGLLASQGIHEPTVPQIAQAAGVSDRTVQRFRQGQGMGAGNLN